MEIEVLLAKTGGRGPDHRHQSGTVPRSPFRIGWSRRDCGWRQRGQNHAPKARWFFRDCLVSPSSRWNITPEIKDGWMMTRTARSCWMWWTRRSSSVRTGRRSSLQLWRNWRIIWNVNETRVVAPSSTSSMTRSAKSRSTTWTCRRNTWASFWSTPWTSRRRTSRPCWLLPKGPSWWEMWRVGVGNMRWSCWPRMWVLIAPKLHWRQRQVRWWVFRLMKRSLMMTSWWRWRNYGENYILEKVTMRLLRPTCRRMTTWWRSTRRKRFFQRCWLKRRRRSCRTFEPRGLRI